MGSIPPVDRSIYHNRLYTNNAISHNLKDRNSRTFPTPSQRPQPPDAGALRQQIGLRAPGPEGEAQGVPASGRPAARRAGRG